MYFLVNMIAALFEIIAYIWVSRKYQYRQRDEPDNIYRYVDEYYLKLRMNPTMTMMITTTLMFTLLVKKSVYNKIIIT